MVLLNPPQDRESGWEFSHLDSTYFQDFFNLFSQAYLHDLNLIQMDNGRFHKSLNLKLPENVIPIFPPPNSPELNPIKRLWEHIKYKLAWKHCTTLDELRRKLKQVQGFPLTSSACFYLWMGLYHFCFIKCNFIENWY